MHAARLCAFVGRALAAADPLDAPLEERVLVAAGKVGGGDRLEGCVSPEGAFAEELRRAWPVEAHGRREGQLAEMRDARVHADERGGAGDEVPELREIELVPDRLEGLSRVDLVDQGQAAGPRAPDGSDALVEEKAGEL